MLSLHIKFALCGRSFVFALALVELVGLASSLAPAADSGVAAKSICLTADAGLSGVWINGHAAGTGAQAMDWSQPKELGSCADLRCLAASAQAGTGMGHAGLIGAVVLADGRWVMTDGTWRAWPGNQPPTPDADGRPWTAPDYDDHAWPFATEIGPYGTGPWGAGEELPPKATPHPALDAAMRLLPMPPADYQLNIPEGTTLPAGTDFSIFLKQAPRIRLWNAVWIWAGPPLGGAPQAYFRKVFTGGAGIPPNRPQAPRVTAVSATGFTLQWQPSFSAQGAVTYELAWNGQMMLSTSETHGSLSGLSINPIPQNYAWVRAVAPDGTRSAPSDFVLVATPGKTVPGAVAHARVTGRNPHGLGIAWDPAPDDGELAGYDVLVNHVFCAVPPGVCTATVNIPQFLAPGQPVKVQISARDIDNRSGPKVTLEDSTAPLAPVDLAAPAHLRITASLLTWDAAAGATAYRLWRDGMAVPGRVTGTSVPLPPGDADGFVQVSALDDAGNASPRSAALPLGHPGIPDAPILSDGGRSGDLVVLRWSRPAAGTCIGYRVEQEQTPGLWKAIARIDDPWQDTYTVGPKDAFQAGSRDCLPVPGASPDAALQPGATYRFRVVAFAPDVSEVTGAPLAVTTVAPPAPNPRLRFAVIIATDGRYDYLEHSLADADAANCAFALIKGQIVPQICSDPKQWDALMAVVRRHKTPSILSLLASKDGWCELSDDITSGADDTLPLWGRYDMATWRTGQPFDQTRTELGGALRVASALENPRSNPAFLPDLERSLQDADADDACRWFFTAGVSTESAPQGIPRIMLELYRPGVDFMRMINGDRGHELAQDPGSAVVCACPQRGRVDAHYLVTVEDRRLVIEARQFDKKTGVVVTDGLQEIACDRAANRIAAANLRVPYPFGIITGLPERADHVPPWTQNRIIACAVGGHAEVRLLGHSARETPLHFTVTRAPLHGKLAGTDDHFTYEPDPGFSGEDLFLYRADDNGPWPGNTAWVRITVGK